IALQGGPHDQQHPPGEVCAAPPTQRRLPPPRHRGGRKRCGGRRRRGGEGGEPVVQLVFACPASTTRLPELQVHRLGERGPEARILPRGKGEVGQRGERRRLKLCVHPRGELRLLQRINAG